MIMAKLCVPSGTLLHSNIGDTSLLSHVNLAGIRSPELKAGVENFMVSGSVVSSLQEVRAMRLSEITISRGFMINLTGR